MKHSIILATVALTIACAATAKKADAEERPDYHHAQGLAFDEDHFDASFYDRKAPNERSDDYRREQIRNSVRSTSDIESALMHGTREEKILIIQEDLRRLREHELAMALQRYSNAQAAVNMAKSSMGWFPSKEDKERLVLLEATAQRHSDALTEVQNQERALEARLKPLYGIVSREFWIEQRRAISNSIETVHKMAVDNAWYSSLFSLGNVESLQELIIQAIGQYVIAGLLFYFFGLVFYALWTAPWTVYAYSSSVMDIIPGIISYFLAVGLMLLPLVACLGSLWAVLYFVGKKEATRNGAAPQARQPQQAPPQQHSPHTQERARQEHQQRQQERYAPQAPRNAPGGFGGPVNDID